MIQEIKMKIPEGSLLIGTRTDGDTVIVIYQTLPQQEPQPEPEPRKPIGFASYQKTAKKKKEREKKKNN